MRTYERPVAIANDELLEGVYMASGDIVGSDCYTVTTKIHQRPETGRGDYRMQVDGQHKATDNHMCENQRLVISFNLPVEYGSSGGTLKGGNNSEKLEIDYHYHNNGVDNIGLGDLVVKADQGLAVQKAVIIDLDQEDK